MRTIVKMTIFFTLPINSINTVQRVMAELFLRLNLCLLQILVIGDLRNFKQGWGNQIIVTIVLSIMLDNEVFWAKGCENIQSIIFFR